jgi:hypothetical protein
MMLFVETVPCGETWGHNLLTALLFKRVPSTGTYVDELYKDYNSFDWNRFTTAMTTAQRRAVYTTIVPDYARSDLYALAYVAYLAIDSTNTRWDTRRRANDAYNLLNEFLDGSMLPIGDMITSGDYVSDHQ